LPNGVGFSVTQKGFVSLLEIRMKRFPDFKKSPILYRAFSNRSVEHLDILDRCGKQFFNSSTSVGIPGSLSPPPHDVCDDGPKENHYEPIEHRHRRDRRSGPAGGRHCPDRQATRSHRQP
jgi:hypothetical protein